MRFVQLRKSIVGFVVILFVRRRPRRRPKPAAPLRVCILSGCPTYNSEKSSRRSKNGLKRTTTSPPTASFAKPTTICRAWKSSTLRRGPGVLQTHESQGRAAPAVSEIRHVGPPARRRSDGQPRRADLACVRPRSPWRQLQQSLRQGASRNQCHQRRKKHPILSGVELTAIARPALQKHGPRQRHHAATYRHNPRPQRTARLDAANTKAAESSTRR